MIVNKLNDGSIWIDYEKCKSPGDGHCFIHSVLSSLNSRVDSDNIIQYKSLVNALRKAVIDNLKFYVSFTKGSSVDRLLGGMNAYIYHKIYDTFFGDIVPHVIIHQYIDSYGVSVVSQHENRSNDVTSYLLVFKTGKHYDGLTHVSSNSDPAVLKSTSLDSNSTDNGEDLSNNIYFSMTAGSELERHIYTGRESITTDRARHNDGPRVNVGREHVIDGNDIDDFSHAGLNIMVWNINGLSQSKVDKRIAGSMLLKYDIILSCETWAAQDAEFFLNGYE